MNEHDRITDLLARHRELTPEEHAELQGHLAGCAECRSTAEVFDRQDALLQPLGAARPAVSVREAVFQAHPAARRRFLWPLSLAAAAVLVVLGGFGIVFSGGLPWVQPDRHNGAGYTGPNSGLFTPATPTPGVVSRSDAIRLALRRAIGVKTAILPPHVAADAFLGTYTDTLFRPRLVWIVRFHGSAINIPGDGGITSPVSTLLCPRPVAHEQTVILDGHSGALVEMTVGLLAQGLPVTVTPAPRPTPCPTAPPTLIAPVSLAVAPSGSIVEVGQTGNFTRYQVQERTPEGRVLLHWSPDATRDREQQVTALAVDGQGDVYLIGNNQKEQKFTPDGRFLWQHSLPASYSGFGSIAVAPDGTAYIPEGSPQPGIRVRASSGSPVAFWPGRYNQVAVGPQNRLFASRGGTITILSTPSGTRVARWHVEPSPGHGYVQAMAAAPDGTLWLLESRFTRTAQLGYEIAHFTADGRLLNRRHLPTVTGSVQVQGSEPSGIAVDGKGRIYVADAGRARVLVFSSAGWLTRSW